MSKEDKQGLIILGVLMFIACIIICLLINTVRANSTRYEYYKDGQFGISKQCYVNDKDTPMCLIDDRFIYVESYYEK